MSPYPTVVVVINAHQKAEGIDLNEEPYSSDSQWYTILANSTIPGRRTRDERDRRNKKVYIKIKSNEEKILLIIVKHFATKNTSHSDSY